MASDAFEALAGFCRELRRDGVKVGTGQMESYCRALAIVDPTDLAMLYWVGRACLVNAQTDIGTYDRVFATHFLTKGAFGVELRIEGDVPRKELVGLDLRGLATQRAEAPEQTPAGPRASELEVLRDKDFSLCTPGELEELRRLMAQVMLSVPQREARRTRSTRSGDTLDLRKALRGAIRTHGMVFPRHWRRRRIKPRTLVLLLDISGSMADYSRALLQFAHSLERTPGRVEVFCFGTRLTRITEQLRVRDADSALAAAAAEVVDWEGGTRIGSSVGTYCRTWGRRSGFRGSVVLICSDGLDRGDPGVLSEELARLRRLAHRVVWINPLKGDPRFSPETRAMRVALPHVDALLSGHNVASLHELADLLPALG